MTDLKRQVKTGIYWSAASNFANKGMQFVFSIILARLLAPSDYGVVGMLTIFITIIQLFVDSGFSQAIITKQDRTQQDLSTAFFFNIGVGILGYAILFMVSPCIARFYGMPILSPILKVSALGVVFNSLSIVQSANFAIRLDFKTPAIISVFSQFFAGLIGIILAYNGFGVWSLVFQQVVGGAVGVVLNWISVRWIPSMEFSVSSFRYMFGYGSKVLGASIISTVYDNIQPLIIGKCFSATMLGLFSRAQSFAVFPSSNFSGILNGVTFPLLSKINGDIQRLASVYRRLIRMSAFIVFPLMIGLAALAEPVVKILLPEALEYTHTIFQIICFSLIWQPISSVNLNLLKAAKRPDIVLKLEIVKKIVGLSFLFASIPFGIIVMCFANLISCIFAVIVNTIMTSRTLGLPFIEQLKDLGPILGNSLIMGSIVYATAFFINNHILVLTIGITIGAMYYIFVSKLFMKDLFDDAIYMIKNRV